VVLQNIGKPIESFPANQVLLSTYHDHLMLGTPAVLGDNNGVDRVATPCEKCQLTRLAKSIDGHAALGTCSPREVSITLWPGDACPPCFSGTPP
jgi:hypothetical protein